MGQANRERMTRALAEKGFVLRPPGPDEMLAPVPVPGIGAPPGPQRVFSRSEIPPPPPTTALDMVPDVMRPAVKAGADFLSRIDLPSLAGRVGQGVAQAARGFNDDLLERARIVREYPPLIAEANARADAAEARLRAFEDAERDWIVSQGEPFRRYAETSPDSLLADAAAGMARGAETQTLALMGSGAPDFSNPDEPASVMAERGDLSRRKRPEDMTDEEIRAALQRYYGSGR